jgi:hypothetical protein
MNAGLPNGLYIFKPKNPKLGKIWKALEQPMLE